MEVVTLGCEEEAVLKGTATLISDIDEKIESFAHAMIESMIESDGIGLAGPQVNFPKRIFVTKAPGDEARIFINPEIIQTSMDVGGYEEGCLSVPGVYAEVMRPLSITIQAWNEKGKPFRLDADGILARVIQHEYDHLKGVLFIDHLNDKKRQRVLKIYNRRNGR
ncbi:MAG: peptide deformylase [Spirochaetales bacterium]|nr:peptide deformylase [Spirochaetales bacterium]